MWVDTSGKIQNQIGASLNAIRNRVEARDIEGVADHLSLLIAISAPKLDPNEKERLKIPPIVGGRDRTGEKQKKLYQDCMTILADLLCILSDKGLYAFKDVPIGDAGELALIPEE